MRELILRTINKWEKGYVDDPDDAGGATRWGISDRRDGVIDGLADVNGDGKGDTPIANLTIEEALAIYTREYWNKIGVQGLDAYPEFSKRVKWKLFDTAVNCGVGTVNKTVSLVPPSPWDDEYLLWRLAELQVRRYVDIVAQKPPQLKFLRGWMERAFDLGHDIQ